MRRAASRSHRLRPRATLSACSRWAKQRERKREREEETEMLVESSRDMKNAKFNFRFSRATMASVSKRIGYTGQELACCTGKSRRGEESQSCSNSIFLHLLDIYLVPRAYDALHCTRAPHRRGTRCICWSASVRIYWAISRWRPFWYPHCEHVSAAIQDSIDQYRLSRANLYRHT